MKFAFPFLIVAFASSVLAAGENTNIVIILADDLGYGDVGCYNADSEEPSPNRDRLAQQGMSFVDAPSQLDIPKADPGETTSLEFKHPEIVMELKMLLEFSKASGHFDTARPRP